MTDDLDVLEPAGSSVTYRGEEVTVSPLTIGQVPRIVRVARPILTQLLALQQAPAGDGPDDGFVDLLAALVGDHGEAAIEALAISVNKPTAWIAGGTGDEVIALATAVYEVNRDFFVRRLGPLLGGRAAAALSGGGPTPSSS